ncbi:hypothetical protein LOTGIDRAFT_143990 [Lottia gigantea]|uniref:Uncharacterized protein n=1 Tax=Lottia gigantea TaxID=225164 RepID=V4ARS3_LOTGI|nr:hypothetical protein LOTGIDRAFT_143990 [Lottia gigantea]ESO96386.1 hypothetical protein LOTGIDRAFT_143990 [Lottia gigantea]
MMENAKWRNEQRKKNVTRYREEEDKEQEEIINDHKSSFVNDMMSEHASKSSLEDRLNRNKHNIQRTQSALDKNFLRK